LVSVDIEGERVSRIRDNLSRLGRGALVVQADIRQPGGFWDGRPFERILVDAPCSSTGVIRRHPDIKLLRRPTDLPAFAETQQAIISACFSMLAPGGRLLYATCSLMRQENEAVMEAFLSAQAGARAVTLPLRAPGAFPRSVGFQLLPGGAAGSDGFYYACVEKTTTGN
jgi:16S rRNA (cytosine967-C5)-methyltransferase